MDSTALFARGTESHCHAGLVGNESKYAHFYPVLDRIVMLFVIAVLESMPWGGTCHDISPSLSSQSCRSIHVDRSSSQVDCSSSQVVFLLTTQAEMQSLSSMRQLHQARRAQHVHVRQPRCSQKEHNRF